VQQVGVEVDTTLRSLSTFRPKKEMFRVILKNNKFVKIKNFYNTVEVESLSDYLIWHYLVN
jgi:hypothetical protein